MLCAGFGVSREELLRRVVVERWEDENWKGCGIADATHHSPDRADLNTAVLEVCLPGFNILDGADMVGDEKFLC